MLFFCSPLHGSNRGCGGTRDEGLPSSPMVPRRTLHRPAEGRTDWRRTAARGTAEESRSSRRRQESGRPTTTCASVIALRGRADGRGRFEAVAGGGLEDGDDVKAGYVDEVGIAKAAEREEGGSEYNNRASAATSVISSGIGEQRG